MALIGSARNGNQDLALSLFIEKNITIRKLVIFVGLILGGIIAIIAVNRLAPDMLSIFSISIEMLQLFLRLGTFQLSDLFYNTVGGMIGGLMYYGIAKAKKHL